MTADKTFAAAIASSGASVAFASTMHEAGRLNRQGTQPMTRTQAVAWLAREAVEMTSEPMKVETGASGDLGYTWGKYTAKGPTQSPSGYYIRVWTRKADGSWQLVSDITTARPASR